MKNKIIYIFVCLLIFAIATTNFVLAEDDNEQEQENNYQPLQSVTISEPIPTATIDNSQLLTVPVPVSNTQPSLIDSDSDGVIDSLDKYPGEDDFAFGITDTNLNGIVDSLEYLQARKD